MTIDEIRRLVGGYATGTLSEAQRRLVFEAALEDQELFDALMEDQELKALLEAPGVRQRLAASIEVRESNPWWKHPLPWAMAGATFSVSLGLFLLVFLTPSGSRPASTTPKETARVRPPVTAEAPLPQQDAEPARRLRNEPKAEPKSQSETAPKPEPAPLAKDSTATPPPPPAKQAEAAPQPPAELQNEPKAKVAQAAPQAEEKGARQNALRDALSQGAVGGFAPAAPRAMAAAAPLPGRFAVDYSIHDGVLRIVPAADGYLMVRAMVGPIDRLILPTSHLVSTRPAELRVPDGATELLILYSARPVQEDSTEDWNTRGTPRKEMTGTVQDPRPSVGSRLELRLSLSN